MAAAQVRLRVGAADTAIAAGSGDVPVLATPRVLALLEAATVAAAADTLGAHETSVGTHVTLEHRAATPVGRVVTAAAELCHRDGRTLVFTARLLDGDVVAAEAQIRRVVVDRARFLARTGSVPT